MASVFCCGFECNLIGPGLGSNGTRHWNTGSGTPTIVSTSLRGPWSTKAGRCTTAAGGAVSFKKTLASQTRVVFRVYIYFETSLPSANCALTDWFVAGAAPQIRYRSSDSAITLSDGTVVVAGPVVVANRWYCFECDGNLTANPNVWNWKWDGVAQTAWSIAQAADAVTSLELGVNAAGVTSANATVVFDDLVLLDNAADYPVGNGMVKGYLAASDGTHGFTTTGHFQKGTIGSLTNAAAADTDLNQSVDNLPTASGTTGVSAAAATSAEYVAFKFAAEPSKGTPPRAVEFVVDVRNAASSSLANKNSARVYDGTTEAVLWTDISLGATGTTNMHLGYHRSTNPSAGTWTIADLGTLQFRWGSSWGTVDISPLPIITALMLEVEFPQRSSPIPLPYMRPRFITRRRYT